MMASKILRVGAYRGEEKSFSTIRDKYRRILSWSISHPGKIITIALMVLFLSLLLVLPIGKEFMPAVNDRMFMIGISLPEGTKLEETDKVAKEVEKILMSLPELETEQVIVGIAGGGSGQETAASHQLMVIVRLVDAQERRRTTPEVIEEVREKISILPQIERADFLNLQTMSMGGGEGKPVEIKVFGKNLPTLAELSRDVRGRIEGIEGLRDVEETFAYGSPEMQVKFDREKSARYGLSVVDVASVLEAAIAGKVATRFEEQGEEIDVRVRLREEDRFSLSDIRKISILTPKGIEVQLGDIARIHKSIGPSEILRENQKRKASVLANISQRRDLGHIMEEVRDRLAGFKMPQGYFIEYGGSYKSMMESYGSLGIAFLLAMLLVYMIMAAQFESLLHPFVIMFSIPFALVGVLWTLFLTGVNLSVNAIVGVVMLSGIVVNNGIVLIDCINRLRREGVEKTEAIIRATQIRFRPILMTTSTTILGVAPMVFMRGSGAEMRRPLALAVMGGLLFGTMITLIIMPAVYSALDNLSSKMKKRFHE
ncbi:Cobalt-zinc-cadmium resistance protein CzcA [subsurface metagenome]